MAKEVAEAQEAGWLGCVDGSARHQAMRAGRAAGGVPPVAAAFAECLRLEQALKEALMAADPSGGSAAADTYIRDLQARLSPQLAAMMNREYQSHNYE